MSKYCKKCNKVFSIENRQKYDYLKQIYCSIECSIREARIRSNKAREELLNLKKFKCLRCDRIYTPKSFTQKYCGGKYEKGSCSYIKRVEKDKLRISLMKLDRNFYKGIVKLNRGI